MTNELEALRREITELRQEVAQLRAALRGHGGARQAEFPLLPPGWPVQWPYYPHVPPFTVTAR